jgi:protein O-mannosyl-transferase
MAKKSSAKTSTQPPKQQPAAPAADWTPWVLAGLAFLLFLNGIKYPMISIDDNTATIDNPAVKNFNLFGTFNLGMFAPLTWLLYAIAYQMGEENATWYHFFSIALHAVNTGLVYLLLRQLKASWAVAAFVAAGFAVHPLQVESVAWIAAQSTPLYVLFTLLTLRFYLKHINTGQAWSNYYWVAVLTFVAACLSKSAAVALPLALLVVDGWLKRPIIPNLKEKALFFAISLGFGWLTIVSRIQEIPAEYRVDAGYSIVDRLLMVCHALGLYGNKFLAPIGLSIWYPFEKTAEGNWHFTYYLAPLLIAGVAFLAWWKRREWPVLGFGLLFFLVNIALSLPWQTVGTFELRFDRYNYLPILGLLAIVAAGLEWLQQRGFKWIQYAGVGLLAVWAILAVIRHQDWSSTINLLDKAIAAQGDNNGKAWYWRGMEIGDNAKGPADVKLAINDFNKAIERNPKIMEAYKYRGALSGFAREYQRSVDDLTTYLNYNPKDAEYRFNRGLSYHNLNRTEEALADLNQTIAEKPDFAPPYNVRGNIYMLLGDSVKANADLEIYKRLDIIRKKAANQKK